MKPPSSSHAPRGKPATPTSAPNTRESASPQKRLQLTLPIELTNGNTGRGHAFWATAKRRTEFEAIAYTHAPRGATVPTPCHIHITRVLGKGQRLWDADSLLRGSAKELIDAIVAIGIIPDDGPKHVTTVTADQDATRRADGPATIITITSLETEEAA